jgi:hypothetical protein
MNVKEAITEYQCAGCSRGCGVDDCFVIGYDHDGCSNHKIGTHITNGVGKVALGMPKGFNRVADQDVNFIALHEKYSRDTLATAMYNIPTWKHLDKHGNTHVRIATPRLNSGYVLIYLENCMDQFDCMEITPEMQEQMD